MDDPRLASMSPDELRSAMRTLGYATQSDLASAIGVSRSAVSLWLEGKVGVPRTPHPLRPVEGFACRRSEVSGDDRPHGSARWNGLAAEFQCLRYSPMA